MTSSESKVLDEVEQKAKEAELLYHGCCRSTLYGLKQHFDFIPEELVTAATALAGGCAHGGNCGAYCAGLLAIGLKYSPPIEDLSDEGEAKSARSREKILAFRDAFQKEFGTTMCSDIQEHLFGRRFNLWDQKEREEWRDWPGHFEKCSSVVAKGTRMAAEFLLEMR